MITVNIAGLVYSISLATVLDIYLVGVVVSFCGVVLSLLLDRELKEETEKIQ